MSDKLLWEVKPSLSRWKKANKMKQAPEEGKEFINQIAHVQY